MNEPIIIKPLNGTAFEICKLIHGYLTHEKSHWSLIDQKWMLARMEEWYGHKIARSTLCYNLKHLVEAGILSRITRHRTNPETEQFEPRVTCYKMTLKLRALFLRVATYFRGIGWMNYLSEPIRKAREASRRAVQAAQEAALPSMTFDEFKASWRVHLGVRT